MKQRFFIAFVMLILLATQLSAQEQEQDYEWQFDVVQLCEREQIVHSRSFSWDPFDHTDSKTCFEFDVPVNTVAIMYAYCSRLTETSIPTLKLMSGITQCVGSISSLLNKNLGDGINKIAEGFNGLSLPSGTGDVDIYLFVDPDDFLKFKEASSSDCEAKYYYPKYDLLNQKSGKKTIKLQNPVENRFTIYLGLLNKDLNDAITVRIEAVAITAKKVPIAKSEEPAVASNAMTIPANQSDQEGGGSGFFIILIVLAVVGAVIYIMKGKMEPTMSQNNNKNENITPPHYPQTKAQNIYKKNNITPPPHKKNAAITEEMSRIKNMQSAIKSKMAELGAASSEIKSDIQKIRDIENKTIANLYGTSLPLEHNDLYRNYDWIKNQFGNKVEPTPMLQCDRTITNAENAVRQKLTLLIRNNELLDKYKKMDAELSKQYNIQQQIENQKAFSSQLNAATANQEERIAASVYSGEMLKNISQEFETLNAEIQILREEQIRIGTIEI